MSRPPLWERLREARMVQVFLVYLGASWIVLQITETLVGLLSLPGWVGPVAVLILLVGLFVVMATAWVQSLPQTTALERAGEVPSDWAVAPGEVIESLRRGELPHLTWGRALMGGVLAICLLFGAAGVYVVVRGPMHLVGPAEVAASGTSSGIAVLPFHVTGPSLELYREGMVDLVSANLDGLSGYRAVDARTVLARWSRELGEGARAELADALRVAAGTGARYAVVGSGVELGSSIRFNADVYDLDSREKVGNGGQVEGRPEEVLGLVDALTVEVMRSLLDATDGGSAAQDFRLASLLTESVPALRHYLEGDAAFRRSRFEEAREHLERAIREDSTFALAHWRLGEAIGWISGFSLLEVREQKATAARFGARLPPREATLLEVSAAAADGRAIEVFSDLEAFLRRYPDDPDGWYLLGEIGLHPQGATGITDERLEEAFYTAVELDPTFGPYYQHALEWASAKGRGARFDSLMTSLEAAGGEEERTARLRLRGDLLLGDEAVRADAVRALSDLSDAQLRALDQSILGLLDRDLDRYAPILEERVRRGMGARAQVFRIFYLEQGRLREAAALFEADSGWEARLGRAELAAGAYELMGVGSDAELRRHYEDLRADDPPEEYALERGFTLALLATLLDDRAGFESALGIVRPRLGPSLEGVPFDTAGVAANMEAVMEGAWLAARDRPDEAYALVASAPPVVPGGPNEPALADFAFQAERWRDAVRIYEGISRRASERSMAKYRLGKAYEALGDRERAADAYRTFLSRFERADPGLPWVEEARSALERLGG